MSLKARKSEVLVNNTPVTKETISKWVKRDIETLYSLAYELLSTEGVIELLSDKMYQRFLAEKAKVEKEQNELVPDENV